MMIDEGPTLYVVLYPALYSALTAISETRF